MATIPQLAHQTCLHLATGSTYGCRRLCILLTKSVPHGEKVNITVFLDFLEEDLERPISTPLKYARPASSDKDLPLRKAVRHAFLRLVTDSYCIASLQALQDLRFTFPRIPNTCRFHWMLISSQSYKKTFSSSAT